MPLLSDKECQAILAVVHEYMAGHDAEMVKASGLASSEKEGALFLETLGRAIVELERPPSGMLTIP